MYRLVSLVSTEMPKIGLYLNWYKMLEFQFWHTY